MRILAMDSSAVSASCALLEDEKLIGEQYLNVGLTHSQTLMPLVEHLLAAAHVKPAQVDGFAVNSGPGSFTGIRIGVAAVKGMAFAQGKPCVGISTLESMAYLFEGFDGVVCGAMDARCQQVYQALFEVRDGQVIRLCEDRALTIAELTAELKCLGKPVLLTGDGAHVCEKAFAEQGIPFRLAPLHLRYQRAYGLPGRHSRHLPREKAWTQLPCCPPTCACLRPSGNSNAGRRRENNRRESRLVSKWEQQTGGPNK